MFKFLFSRRQKARDDDKNKRGYQVSTSESSSFPPHDNTGDLDLHSGKGQNTPGSGLGTGLGS